MIESNSLVRLTIAGVLPLIAAGCLSYERDFDRYSLIPRAEFERNEQGLPPGVDRNCVLERAPAISVTVGPEVQFFEGGYDVSQSMMTRAQRRFESWNLAVAECRRRASEDH